MPAIDLEAHHVWSTLIDMHAHLDKGQIVTRTENPYGSFAGALQSTGEDRCHRWIQQLPVCVIDEVLQEGAAQPLDHAADRLAGSACVLGVVFSRGAVGVLGHCLQRIIATALICRCA